MKPNVTRRDVLRFAGGSALGVMLSPLPWKVTDDLAIWTQNWSWIPAPPRGRVTTALTACALCPAACGVRVRRVGGLPVSVAAAPGSGRTPCSLGLSGHHLPYHPSRVSRPTRLVRSGHDWRPIPVQLDAVLAAIAAAGGRGLAAVIDQRPGRAVSLAWRAMLAAAGRGVYIPAPGREDAPLGSLERMVTAPPGPFGIDLAGAGMVVSFGAPLAEGWGARRLAGDRPRLVQVEARASATAVVAHRWLPAKPGSEALVALGLAHVLLAEGLVDAAAVRRTATDLDAYARLVADLTPETVAAASGLEPGEIVATAREMASHRPAVAVAGCDPGGGPLGREAETAIWSLGLLLGSIGRGGLLPRAGLPQPARLAGAELAPQVELEDVPDGSLSVLVIDGSGGDSVLPWSLVQRKLVPRGGVVVSLSPFLAGSACHCDYVVPTAPYLEALAELPTPPGSPLAEFTLSVPLLEPERGVVDPLVFLAGAAAALGARGGCGYRTVEEIVRSRADEIFRAGRGRVVAFADGGSTPISELASPDAFWSAMTAGARWQDEPAPACGLPRFALLGADAGRLGRLVSEKMRPSGPDRAWPLVLLPFGSRAETASATVSPVFSKLFRESGLRRGVGEAAVNPETGRDLGLAAGRRARLETPSGSIPVRVAFDAAVMPGVVEVAVGPDARSLGERRPGRGAGALDLCDASHGSSWRGTRARLAEA